MKRFLNWLFVLAGCAGAVYGVGIIVPRNQGLGSKSNLASTPDAIYELVADLNQWPAWHPDVASVQERAKRNDHPVWSVETKSGERFDLEVTAVEEARTWQAVYSHDGTRTTLRFDLSWYGTGTRLRIHKTADTRDPWMRARRFFLPSNEVTALGLLNALAAYLGEAAEAEPS